MAFKAVFAVESIAFYGLDHSVKALEQKNIRACNVVLLTKYVQLSVSILFMGGLMPITKSDLRTADFKSHQPASSQNH